MFGKNQLILYSKIKFFDGSQSKVLLGPVVISSPNRGHCPGDNFIDINLDL